MLMVCPYCASNNIITIKGAGFCVNCGHSLAKLPDGSAPAASSLPIKVAKFAKAMAAPAPTPKIQIKSRHQVTSQSAAVAQAAPRSRRVLDLSAPRPTKAAKVAPAPPKTRHPAKPVEAVHPPAGKSADPVHHEHPHQRSAVKPLHRSHIISASTLASGLLAAAIVIKSYLVVHTSRAASLGGFMHYLATRSTHTKLVLAALLPPVVVAALSVIALWLWLRASAIYAASRLHDHRPVNHSAANRVGLNVLGGLMSLAATGSVVAAIWSVALAAAIKSLGTLSLGNWQLAAIGVATSFAMVLIGLWLVAALTLAGYVLVLSGRSFFRSIGDGLRLASRDYVNNAATALGLGLTLVILVTVITTSFVGLSRASRQLQPWVIASLGGLLAAGLMGWFSQFALNHWVRRYRLSTGRVFGPKQPTLYLAGRQPRPNSRLGLTLVALWWLAIAGGGGWLLWHYRVDPTSLLNRLAANIY